MVAPKCRFLQNSNLHKFLALVAHTHGRKKVNCTPKSKDVAARKQFGCVSFSCLLCRGPLSAGTHARCTSETMIVSSNRLIDQLTQRFYVKNRQPVPAFTRNPHLISQLLIEVAIVYLDRERKERRQTPRR